MALTTLSVSDIVVSEAAGYAEFVVRLNAPIAEIASVNYRTQSATASNSYDYDSQSGTLSFAPGVTTQTVRITLDDDATVESLQSFYLVLSNPTANLILANDMAQATIVDNDALVFDSNGNSTLDAAEKANLSIRDVVVDERAGTATFDLVLSKVTTEGFSVAYSTGGGTATAGSDYIAISDTISFAAGQTTQRITVNIANDTVAENTELFNLTLGALSGTGANQVVLADKVGTAFIGGNDQTVLSTPTLSVEDILVSEADGYAEFVVRLNAPTTANVSVQYKSSSGEASSAYDFESHYGTLNFAPGVTTQTVRVALDDDTSAEFLESFQLELYNPSANVKLANNKAQATIVDDDALVFDSNANSTLDAAEKANLSIRDVVVDERAGTATFDLVLSKATTESFSVAYSTGGGTATAGSDYVTNSGTLSFAAGQTTQRITVNITDDTAAENTELFNLTLGALSGTGASQVVLADKVGTAFIGGNDQTALSTPTLSVDDIIVSEADGYAEFVVRLNAPTTANVSVQYTTTAGEASSSYDYDTIYGTLNFAPGVTTQTVRVALNDDSSAEFLESLSLELHTPSANVKLANNKAQATIVDDDTAVGDSNGNNTLDAAEKANLSIRDVVVDERAGTATFDLVLSKATTESFSVAYSTGGGTATAGSDYVANSGTLSFAAGQTTQRITVNITDDTAAENTELFNLTLGALSGTGASQVVLADKVGTAFIGGNDQTALSTPTLSVDDILVSEADGYAEFVVRLNAPATANVSVQYTTTSGEASSSYDYDTVYGTLNFAPGETTQTVRIALNDDATAESLESLSLELHTPSANVKLANQKAQATIVDDDTWVSDSNGNNTLDAAEKANLSVRDVVVDERAGTATFDLVLSKATTESFSVAYSTGGGTATAGSDYTASSGTLSFAAGQTTQRITVNITDDTVAENIERFNLTLGALSGSGASQVVLADKVGTTFIGGNDQTALSTPTLSVEDILVSEADGYAEFVVRLNAPATANVSVQYATSSGTAYSSSDYNHLSGTLNFAPGVTTQTVRIALDDNATAESLESFYLQLSNPSANVTLAKSKALATIVDDDNGIEILRYGNGDDLYSITKSSQSVTEFTNGGSDTVYSYLAAYTLGSNVENGRIMSSGTANLTGNGLNNLIYSGVGNNVIDGTSGTDSVSYLFGNNGAGVTVSLASTAAQATGGSGSDTLKGIENLFGTNYADKLTGNTGANELRGYDGNDTIDGGTGNDKMAGNAGNDSYFIRDSGDVVTEAVSEGTDTVFSYLSAHTLASNVENGRIMSGGTANLNGNAHNNTIFAGAGNNVLKGEGGTDTISYAFGLTGTATTGVTVSLASTSAQATGGSGSDTISGFENLTGSSKNDKLIGSGGNNVIDGSAGNDNLSGGDGNDTLIGGAGKDTLVGGNGNDNFDFNALSEMGVNSTTWDIISDFVRGQDRIDLSTLDANTATATNDAFSGTLIASSGSFTAAGQLKFASGVLYGNTDADADFEFAIQLVGVANLSSTDFLL